MLVIQAAKFEKIEELETKTKLIFSTKEELDPITLYQALDHNGFFAFNGDEFEKKVEQMMRDKKVAIREDGKSWSQVLRGVLSQIALNDGQDPEGFYAEKMEEIVNHFKKQLNQ